MTKYECPMTKEGQSTNYEIHWGSDIVIRAYFVIRISLFFHVFTFSNRTGTSTAWRTLSAVAP